MKQLTLTDELLPGASGRRRRLSEPEVRNETSDDDGDVAMVKCFPHYSSSPRSRASEVDRLKLGWDACYGPEVIPEKEAKRCVWDDEHVRTVPKGARCTYRCPRLQNRLRKTGLWDHGVAHAATEKTGFLIIALMSLTLTPFTIV